MIHGREDAVKMVLKLTGGLGADVAVEAVGVPATFELAAELIRAGGTLANVGVHGKPATLHLEKHWIKDVTITTGLVDTRTIPQLLSLIEGVRGENPRAESRSHRDSSLSRKDLEGPFDNVGLSPDRTGHGAPAGQLVSRD